LRDFFGIASPSKLFEDQIGRYLAQGIGVGFADEMENVSEQMRQAVPTSFDVTGETGSVGSIGGGLDYYTLVNALREALSGMTVEMDDVTMGSFVRKTVADSIYYT
jgi:tetrahydromethanopterin S-methyltransferase subunit D